MNGEISVTPRPTINTYYRTPLIILKTETNNESVKENKSTILGSKRKYIDDLTSNKRFQSTLHSQVYSLDKPKHH
jgi:hypothetical protein